MIKTTLLFLLLRCVKLLMLSALVVVKTKRQYLAVASGGDFTGAVCLVVNVASSGEWACLRGLWWRLCLHGVDVAARCGWRETDSL